MKKYQIIFGGLSLILLGGMLRFPSLAQATYVPIYFYNYSLTNSVATFDGPSGPSGTKNQTLFGVPPINGKLTQSNLTTSGTSTSSIVSALNPSTVSITQTGTAAGHVPGPGSNYVSENSVLSVDFNGTGHHATFSVIDFQHNMAYRDGDADGDYFSSDLSLTVKNDTTNSTVAYLSVGGYAQYARQQTVTTGNFTSYAPFNADCCLPGPFFLSFVTQSNDVYNISVDMSTQIDGFHPFPGSGLANFQLHANAPEPSTWLLFGTGVLFIGFMGLRKQNALVNKA
ncbi:MAG: PEP-CTERM sorting domain-containing protein [Leptospirales bacterium]